MSPAILVNMAAWVTLVGYFKMLAFGFIGLFGIVWTAISLYLVNRSRRSQSWPEAVGTVVSAEVRKIDTGAASTRVGYSLTYEPYIKYQYCVGASKFENDTYALAALPWTADPAPAQAILKGYPVGGQVPVFYDPSNPKNSALVPGGSRGNWYFLLIGLVFMAAGALGLLRRW